MFGADISTYLCTTLCPRLGTSTRRWWRAESVVAWHVNFVIGSAGTAIRQSQGLCCAKCIMLVLHKHGFLLRGCVLRQAGGGLSYAFAVFCTVWNTPLQHSAHSTTRQASQASTYRYCNIQASSAKRHSSLRSLEWASGPTPGPVCPPLFSTQRPRTQPPTQPPTSTPTWKGTWPPTSFPQHQPPIRTESAVGKRHQPRVDGRHSYPLLDPTQPSLDPCLFLVLSLFSSASDRASVLHSAALRCTAPQTCIDPGTARATATPPTLRARSPNCRSLPPDRGSALAPLTVIPMPPAAVLPRQ